ncbi:hypothetical protein BDZ45DRAFT_808585 [Acephala macrosclerotiorum]|nr:hypothetical protein BDZ45DRAFT_808585 [Acephala macrosclerotiorum]
MAILKEGNDKYELRIKSYTSKTYFDEHVKVEDREKPGDWEFKRHIIGEEGFRIWERELTFYTLKRSRERRGPEQFESNSGHTISLVDDDLVEELKPSIEQSNASDDSSGSDNYKPGPPNASRRIKTEPKDKEDRPTKKSKHSKTRRQSIKGEDTSDNELPAKKRAKNTKLSRANEDSASASDEEDSSPEYPVKNAKVRKSRRKSISKGDVSVHGDLEKEKAKARKLADEIETKKELAKLQTSNSSWKRKLRRSRRRNP